MEVIIRIVLMFVFIQFLVVVTIMAAALLLARPEVPALGRDLGNSTVRRSYAWVIQLPGRVFRPLGRLLRAMYLRNVN